MSAREVSVVANRARPFLKWAGGKRQLLPVLRGFYPRAFGTYHEPFLGSGAVFFDLYNGGLLEGRQAVLSDLNDDLVGCYTTLRHEARAVIAELASLAASHRADPAGHYYTVRDRRFNPQRRELRAGVRRWWECYTPALAAMLIYLNRTGFNGLFRLNGSGDFNVPAGRYTNPKVCDGPALLAAASALQQQSVRIARRTFATALRDAHAGDFVYLDPPYAPLSRTADFTSYTAAGFSSCDQEALQRAVVSLAGRGCFVLLSNSTAPEIRALYAENADAERVGLQAYPVAARRAINSNGSMRGEVQEYVITNIPGNTRREERR